MSNTIFGFWNGLGASSFLESTPKGALASANLKAMDAGNFEQAQPHVIVRVATLDDNPGIKPVTHIWTSHDVPWLAYEDIPSFPEWQSRH